MQFQISHTHINPVWLIAVGFVVGLCGGFFGVGGSFLAGPALFGFGVPMNFVVGTDLAHIVGKSIVAARKHGTMGNIDMKLAGFMVFGTIIGVEFGAQLIQYLKKTAHIDLVVGASFILLLLAISGSLLIVHAGLRGPGKYSGVVIFDRWDTCLLLSGDYITYVSEEVKEHLRPYKDQAIQLDATEVFQPMNPGDALIRRYKILGPAPEPSRAPAIEGARITVKSDFDVDRTVAFLITLENSAASPIQIESDGIGPTLLGLNPTDSQKTFTCFSPSDGKSVAWITRGTLAKPSSGSCTYDHHLIMSASYSIDPSSKVPDRFNLNPGESKQVRVVLKVPAGPYQFLVGFGGGVHEGRSLASNAISFHVDRDGTPALDD